MGAKGFLNGTTQITLYQYLRPSELHFHPESIIQSIKHFFVIQIFLSRDYQRRLRLHPAEDKTLLA